MPIPKNHDALVQFPFAQVTCNGRAPMFRFLGPHDALVLERQRARDIGHNREVDEGIRRLLAAETKREARTIAHTLVLTGQSFFDLVENCGLIGYTHREGHRHDVPEGRALTSADRTAIYLGNISEKVGARIRDGYREQVHLSWHAFDAGQERRSWHCFLYELRDFAGDPLTGEPQSTSIGPHVHYTSHHFRAGSLDEFERGLQHPGARVPHDLHVAFKTSFSPG